MIKREDYSDEDWQELLARAKIFHDGSGHELELGDWFWANDKLLLQTTKTGETHDYDPSEVVKRSDAIWIASVDQLLKFFKKGWGVYHTIIGWHIYSEDEDWMNECTNLELAGYRALMNCMRPCQFLVEDTKESMTVCNGRPCAGVHPTFSLEPGFRGKVNDGVVVEITSISHVSLMNYNGPHHCLEHWRTKRVL